MATRYATLFLCLAVGPLLAQLQDNTWLLGNSGFGPKHGLSRLTFLDGSLRIDTVKNIGFSYAHSSAILSDEAGQFEAAFTGAHMIDRNFGLMENGYRMDEELVPNYRYRSSIYFEQGSVMLPWPEHPDSILLLYSGYVIYVLPNGLADVTCDGLNMAIIDKKGNGGLGKVTLRYKGLIEDTIQYGRLNPVRHANGRDWWLLVNERDTRRFYRILIDPRGPVLVGQQTVGFPLGNGADQGAFSPDGTKYAIHNGVDFGDQGASLNVFDFDRCSGLLYNHRQIVMKGHYGGVAISRNNRYLYQNRSDTVFQYDLWAPDIRQSREVVAVYNKVPMPIPMRFYQAQLAPDGKIYSSVGSVTFPNLHVIHAPDKPGSLCGHQQGGIKLPKYNGFCVPNLPHFRLGPLDNSPCDTLGLNNVPVAWYRYEQDTLDPLSVAFTDLSYYEPAEWYWDFGDGSLLSRDTSPTHVFPDKGAYKVCLTVRNQYGTHTHCKTLYLGVSAQDNPVLQAQIQVSPNPFSERLAVALSAPELRGAAFRLFDATGRLVREMRLEYGINEVETSDLGKGMYFWAVERGGVRDPHERGRVKNGKIVKM